MYILPYKLLTTKDALASCDDLLTVAQLMEQLQLAGRIDIMVMVGHIAKTGQVVATGFRPGNVASAHDNLAFIKQCQAALPEGCRVDKLRLVPCHCYSPRPTE